MLQIGTAAPDFILNSTDGQPFSLHDLRGSNIVLAFYPADWSPVCSDQMTLINQSLPLLKKNNAVALGISVDGKWCHLAFSQNHKLNFPLLADFEPKGKVATMYDVYNNTEGVCERALYLIDATGIIRWNYLSPMSINPGLDGLLDALENLTN